MDEVAEDLVEDAVVSVVDALVIPVVDRADILPQEVVAHVQVGLALPDHLAPRVAVAVGLEVAVADQVEQEVLILRLHIAEVVEQFMYTIIMDTVTMVILIMISLLHIIILCIGGYLGISGIHAL